MFTSKQYTRKWNLRTLTYYEGKSSNDKPSAEHSDRATQHLYSEHAQSNKINTTTNHKASIL